jgi:hypothetical protein
LYTFLCHRRKTVGILRIDHGTSTFAQLTETGHEKGGIEDDIRNPDRRGRHSETLTKRRKEHQGEERPKYGGHKKRGQYLDRTNSIQFHLNWEAEI